MATGPCGWPQCPSLAAGLAGFLGVWGKYMRFGVQTETPFLCPPIVTPKILNAMSERQSEFTNFKPVHVAVGTWNVNGGKQFRSNLLGTAELADWLLDTPSLCRVAGPPGECSRVRVMGVDPPRCGPRPQVGSWVFGLLAPQNV